MKDNVEKNVQGIIAFVQDYFKKNKLTGAIIGISGGKDSAVCAALLTKALGKKNVYGLWLPCDSNENDYHDAQVLANYYGFSLETFDLSKMYHDFVNMIKEQHQVDEKNLFDANINLKPRMRMMSLYYYAAMLTSMTKKKYIVAGTSNKCEKYVGYFTKGGDNVCDISLLGDLKVSEVIAIGEYLNVPKEILYKTPSDGLRNISDEEVMHLKYADIEKYLDGEGDLLQETKERIKHLHEMNQHKFIIPEYRKCD